MDNPLPPEYQAELDRAERKRRLAQVLMQQGMNLQMPQNQGRLASKISPFALLANLGTSYLGGRMEDSGAKASQDVRQRYRTDETNAIKEFQSLTPEAQGPYAQTSNFRNILGPMAKALQDRRDKRNEVLGGYVAKVDPAAAVRGFQTGFEADYSLTEPAGPEFKTAPDGTQYMINTGEYGRKTGVFKPPAMSVSQTSELKLPTKEGELNLAREINELEQGKKDAQSARANFATAERLYKNLQQGASVGGGGSIKQQARKFAQAFGIDFPETGPTEEAKQRLGKVLIQDAKAFGGNPTEGEGKRIEATIGNIDTDPTAIATLIAEMQAKSLKTLQDYGDFIEIKRNGKGEKLSPGMYTTADVGIRMPNPIGDTAMQLRVMEALKQLGGDLSRFRNPSGAPFDPNATFNMVPRPIKPPTTPDTGALSKDQRIEQLERELGIRK